MPGTFSLLYEFAVGVDGMVRLTDGVSLNVPTEISADWWQEQGPNSREEPGL